jgi:manganese/zinc/iron transport system permease protein
MTLGANTLVVLAGCTLLGATCGAVGVFAVARRRALLADVASHATLPGACAAFLAASALGLDGRNAWVLLAGAAASAALAAWASPALARFRGIGEEAATAVTLAGFFGLGAVLLSVVQSGDSASQGGLSRILLGSAAALTQADLATVLVLALAVLGVVVALFKELCALTFDAAHARASGLRVDALDRVLLALVVVAVVAGMQIVGAVLVVSLLLAPAAAARQVCARMPSVAIAAAAFGGASAALGVLLSRSELSVPTGSAIALVATAAFLATVALRARRASAQPEARA